MKRSTNECVKFVTQAKNALVAYFETLDSSALSQQNFTIDNILEIVDHATCPPKPPAENEIGFWGRLTSVVTAPVTYPVSWVSSAATAIYNTFHKQLSEERKVQLRYIGILLSMIEQAHQTLNACSTPEDVKAVEEQMTTRVSTFFVVVKNMCDKHATDKWSVNLEGFRYDLCGMKGGRDKSDLAEQLHKKVFLLYPTCDAINQSILLECSQLSANLHMLANKERALAEKQEQIHALEQRSVTTSKVVTNVLQSFYQKKNEANTEAQQLRDANTKILQRIQETEARNSELVAASAQHQGWSQYREGRINRLHVYQQELNKVVQIKGDDGGEHPVVRLIKTGSPVDFVSHLAKGGSVHHPKVDECLKTEAPNDVTSLVQAAKIYNLNSCFELVTQQKEAECALSQLRASANGKRLVDRLGEYRWCEQVMKVLLHPEDSHNSALEILRKRKEAELDKAQAVLTDLLALSKFQALVCEHVIAREVATFYLSCIAHIRHLKLDERGKGLTFAAEFIMKKLAPVVRKLRDQVDNTLRSARKTAPPKSVVSIK